MDETVIRIYIGDKEYVVTMDYVQRVWEEAGQPILDSKEAVGAFMETVLSRIQQEENAEHN